MLFPAMRIIRQSALIASPWKNGGGTTREVIREPPGNGAFRWRLSIADIELPGPFSEFADQNRTMVLLRGAGVRLTFDKRESACLTAVGSWVAFDGAAATNCELLGGPCVDLNLMVSKAVGLVPISISSLAASSTYDVQPGQTLLIFAVAGGVKMEDASGEEQTLNAWDLGVVSSPGRVTASPSIAGSTSQVLLAVLDETQKHDCH